jgi:autophagy-related protein 13
MSILNTSDTSSDGSPTSLSKRNTEVILERWRVELKPTSFDGIEDFGPILPTIYKKCIVFFRSLFVAARVLPAWKFCQQAMTKGAHPSLQPRCRIRMGQPDIRGPDRLRHPLHDARSDVVTDYIFGDLEVPVGRLYASVTYRNDCNFRVDDSEALLSSRFMGVDENFFKPTLPQRADGRPDSPPVEVGSLPSHRHGRDIGEPHQTYGSLSTFHGNGALATSPMTALRAVKSPGSDSSSPPDSAPVTTEPDPPHSMPISGYGSTTRPPLRGFEGHARRSSLSFQPFKAGSLSGSPVPRAIDSASPASPQSGSRASGLAALTQARNRNSLTAGMPASLRGVPTAIDTSVASSPRPNSTSKYSSSFTHRKGRLSFGGTSKALDDEQGSSGRQSLSSSIAQPGSGLLAEPGAVASSGSFQTDDDNISEFLKALESKKTLKSFEPAKKGESATHKTVAQLSKFHLLRDSHNALTESMTSSMQMHRSSSSSSRQLTSVPGMVAPTSMSTSSSPGKPLSPHTPHTPAIPSRLSENSIMEHNAGQARIDSRLGGATTALPPDTSREDTITQDGTTAIDIPLSPRLGSHGRRSSSVAQQNRAMVEDDEADLPFAANRSTSLGADEREPPTMSILLGQQMQGEVLARGPSPALQPPAEIRSGSSSNMMRQASSEGKPPSGLLPPEPSTSPFGRRRYAGMGATISRIQSPAQSSRGGGMTTLASRLARAENEMVDEEPLLFDMSEMDALSRRSLEEGRGGQPTESASGERGGFEPRGTSRRGW